MTTLTVATQYLKHALMDNDDQKVCSCINELLRSYDILDVAATPDFECVFKNHVPHLSEQLWLDVLPRFQKPLIKNNVLCKLWVESRPQASHMLSSSPWHLNSVVQHVSKFSPTLLNECLSLMHIKDHHIVFHCPFGLYDMWSNVDTALKYSFKGEESIELMPYLQATAQYCPDYVRNEVIDHIVKCLSGNTVDATGDVMLSDKRVSSKFVGQVFSVLDFDQCVSLINQCTSIGALKAIINIPEVKSVHDNILITQSLNSNRLSKQKSKL